jgi:predicted nucleic acid-binding protein
MPTVIFDTDFLSSFLKIDRCGLIRAFYQVDQAFIPAAVHRELARTDLLTPLLAIRWISVSAQEPSPDETLLQDTTFQALGAGERACISLAHTLSDVVLLMSDNQARHFARSVGVTVVNIPAFLLACKMSGLVEPDQMIQIIQDLNEKDYYRFKSSVRDLLLE